MNPLCQASSALVVVRSRKSSWCPEQEAMAVEDDNRPRAWLSGRAEQHLEINPAVWRWPKKLSSGSDNSSSLLDFSTIHLYKLLVASNRCKKRQPLTPRWRLSLGAQKAVWKLVWLSPGLLPKVRASLWRMYQSALPNGDRYDGHLVLLGKEFCGLCPGDRRQKSNHMFFECSYAQIIWQQIELWLRGKFPRAVIHIGSRTALTGLRYNANAPLRKEQWWVILHMVFYNLRLWVGWTAATFGSDELES